MSDLHELSALMSSIFEIGRNAPSGEAFCNAVRAAAIAEVARQTEKSTSPSDQSPRNEWVQACRRVKANFQDAGVTVASWSDANGFRRSDVYRVLNDFTPCKRGRMHDIAVALGLKKSA